MLGREHLVGGERPKIAALLARAEAAPAREELELAERLRVPPSRLRGRPTTTAYLYDADGRVARTVEESPWTPEDRALMLAWRQYQASLCSGCGEPRRLAHHADNDGWYQVTERVTCHGCTALEQAKAESSESKEPVKPVEYLTLAHPRDYEKQPLPEQR